LLIVKASGTHLPLGVKGFRDSWTTEARTGKQAVLTLTHVVDDEEKTLHDRLFRFFLAAHVKCIISVSSHLVYLRYRWEGIRLLEQMAHTIPANSTGMRLGAAAGTDMENVPAWKIDVRSRHK
jgi:hypothetical protein